MTTGLKKIKAEPANAPSITIYNCVMEGVVEKKEGREVYELIGMEEVKTPKVVVRDQGHDLFEEDED